MSDWNIMTSIILIGILLFVGKALKTRVPFLNRIVLPSALLGGFVGLLFSDAVIPGSYHVSAETMTTIVYHMLALGFITLTLKDNKPAENKKKIWSTGMLITSTYALQGFIGILMVLLFFSDKSVAAGMLLPLGFGQGPGLATNFARNWSNMLTGVETSSAALGASYAVVGFLVGGSIGVFLINMISRKRGLEKPKQYEDESLYKATIEVDTVKEINVIDGLTVQVVIISIIYGLVWLTLFLLEKVLLPLGDIGNTIFNLLIGFNFIIGIFYSLLFKVILKATAKRGINVSFVKNDYILSNLSSLFFNFMITGAVLTITFGFLREYGWLLLAITAVGAVSTLAYVWFLTKKVYTHYNDEYFVGLFGMLTGVASTGIALLKGIDHNLETPVADEMAMGSATAITMALPLFAILTLPSLGFQTANESLFNYIALFGCLIYCLTMFTILLIRGKRRVN
jgi:ESS family glutamate:Na+ symporter